MFFLSILSIAGFGLAIYSWRNEIVVALFGLFIGMITLFSVFVLLFNN
ncbi:hypothetical protein LP032_104 [Listeria phage LP-032]|uniref:Transmembrane protein n=2 Tax=Homburgvirus LP26 TaxID=1921126 RepID=A0A059TA15_9CAUD|nr:hypothetical protein LP026_061 [Listeria phage LP-026]AHL18953.1 hypothetical protein LP032_104 [Listeria phage LP-032]AHN84755.1 hypothetical protein LP026_061 [Listeria phage LP-026]